MKGQQRRGKHRITRLGYTEEHARSGLDVPLPPIETFPNQFKGYEVTIEIPEYTAICPKTGLPDFGTIRLRYMPDKACVELKSLKLYIHAYRNVGIFYENAVNRILQDVVKACRPVWAVVTGHFAARGGLSSTVEAKYP
jgi:7-cyano-7-deazaguanine reductase